MRHIPTPNRVMAPCRWYGGKALLAKHIVPLLPRGRVYVEPYMGMASVFWHLDPPYPVEVLNDIDGRVVNLFRVLQDRAMFCDFAHRVRWTMYARDELQRAIDTPDDSPPVDRAWAFFVRCNMGMSGIPAVTAGKWSRTFESSRGMAETASKWRSRVSLLRAWHDRLSRVQIDSRDALEVIRYWDTPDTVFYLDPPYVHSTRAKGNTAVYGSEQSDSHHAELVATLLAINGQAVLSGYDTPIYAPLTAAGWRRVDIETACFAAGRVRGSGLQGIGAVMEKAPRTEVLWVKGVPDGMMF